MAYGKYLSLRFHDWMNTVVRERMEEMADPELAANHEQHSIKSLVKHCA